MFCENSWQARIRTNVFRLRLDVVSYQIFISQVSPLSFSVLSIPSLRNTLYVCTGAKRERTQVDQVSASFSTWRLPPFLECLERLLEILLCLWPNPAYRKIYGCWVYLICLWMKHSKGCIVNSKIIAAWPIKPWPPISSLVLSIANICSHLIAMTTENEELIFNIAVIVSGWNFYHHIKYMAVFIMDIHAF